MQLDLFAHSRDVMLRNDLVRALGARDLAASRKARARLADVCPRDAMLAPCAMVIGALELRIRPFADPEVASQTINHLNSALHGAAMEIFGAARAQEWLVPLWLAAAEAVSALPFRPDHSDAHAAALLMRARQWDRAREAAQTIPSWRRIPQPLAWMSEIAFELEGLEAAWPLLAELAWLDPVRFAALARRLAAPRLARLLRDFDRDLAADDDAALVWFPAWALVAEPGLSDVLRAAQTPAPSPPEQAAHAVMQLLALERQGRHQELVAKRKLLRALHADLFERYMATRD